MVRLLQSLPGVLLPGELGPDTRSSSRLREAALFPYLLRKPGRLFQGVFRDGHVSQWPSASLVPAGLMATPGESGATDNRLSVLLTRSFA